MYKDTIYGGGGDDYINGDVGDDVIYAGDGNDRVAASHGNNFVDGGAGNDQLSGGNSYGYSSSDTIYGGEGNDTIKLTNPADGIAAVLNGGSGNDNISLYIYKTLASASVNAGDGIDSVSVYMGVDSAVSVDLTEAVQYKDTLKVTWDTYESAKPLNPVVVHGFSLTGDVLDMGYFDLYGSTRNADESQYLGYGGVVSYNYTQTVTSTSTDWMLPQGTGVDRLGKGVFIIKGAQATAADTTTVAQFLDPYGNNASYGKSESHYFVFDIANVGMGVYYFKDDTGANARVVADELVPVVVLAGVSTASLDTNPPGFFMV